MSYHLTRRSGDRRTILMYAARSGNAEALCEVAKACQAACYPKTVSGVMHVASCIRRCSRGSGVNLRQSVGQNRLVS